jgi:hypothetical protein
VLDRLKKISRNCFKAYIFLQDFLWGRLPVGEPSIPPAMVMEQSRGCKPGVPGAGVPFALPAWRAFVNEPLTILVSVLGQEQNC